MASDNKGQGQPQQPQSAQSPPTPPPASPKDTIEPRRTQADELKKPPKN